MKKTNKGFSLVELIIVIAIMAILAGALAPALIKYINKSRLSSDVQTGNTIATAIQAALANEEAYDCATEQTTWAGQFSANTFWNNPSDKFASEVISAVGASAPKQKAKKDIDGTPFGDKGTFHVSMNPIKNSVTVWAGTTTGDKWQVFPSVGKGMSK